MSPPRWLRDEPVDLRTDDQFGVDQLVDRLVELLARAKPPFTLSLSGAWGVGKSTVANAIVERLRERNIRATTVDAWTQDVKQLRRSVVIEVGAALKSGSDDDRRSIARELDEARAVQTEVQSARIEGRELRPTVDQVRRSWVAYLAVVVILGVSWCGSLTLDKDSGLRPAFVAVAAFLTPVVLTSVFFKLVTPSTSRAPASEELELATKFEEIVTKQPGWCGYQGPIVIVVDNLDRLSGADALTALSQIRALVEIEGSRCIFFIPIDRMRLAVHLGRELRDPQAAADYLEKFFNLDLQLAQPEPIDLYDWARTKASQLFPAASELDWLTVAEIAVSAAGRSPRTVTRILNGTFTRFESLSPTDSIGLRQLVFVEGLLAIAPDLADQLAGEPRAFVEARQELGRRSDAEEQTAVLSPFLRKRSLAGTNGDRAADEGDEGATQIGLDQERLRRYLATNSDIALTPEQLRLALTLRDDRLWKGVPGADSLKDALETGDAASYSGALEGRTSVDRDLALARSVEFVKRHVEFRRVATRALSAMASEVHHTPSLEGPLHRAAIEALSGADAELFATLTRPAVEFVFGRHSEVKGQDKVRAGLMAAIRGATGQPITSLVLGARLVADQLGPGDLEAARQRFATATLDEQAPIFEDPPCVLLADGPVSAALFESLGTWTPASAGPEQTVVRADRLIALIKNGWDGQMQLTALAVRLFPQIAELTAAPEVLTALDALTRLFACGAPAAEFDQFGTQLAARRTLGDQEVFQFALRLPLQAPALTSVGTEIQTWMQTAAPALIEPLLSDARARVAEALPSYRQVLFDLWESKGDMKFAALAVGGDPARLGDLAAKWTALPPANCLQQAVPALDLTAEVGDRSAVVALLERIVARVDSVPFASFAALPTVAEWLVRHNYERQSLREALETRVRAATTPADIQAIGPAAIASADLFGGRQRAGLAEALADKFVSLSTGDPGEVTWLVKHLTAHGTRERLLVQLVERGLPIGPTLEAVTGSRDVNSPQVFDALVSRASREADEADAKALLDEAKAWQRPHPSAGSDARANLDAVGEKFPALKEQADGLLSSWPG